MILRTALLCCLATAAFSQASAPPSELTVDWSKTIATSRATPTLQVVVNPQLLRGAKLHDSSFAALHALGADYVRYVPWLPYPRQAVAELSAPTATQTSWDFSHIDPTLDDFMHATEGHSVILNFSTIPAWMWKIDKPVVFPGDPNEVFWKYTQGTELLDPTFHQAADYFARLLGWYTQGGFTDENSIRHNSGHHYIIAYWEVLNEIDFEHNWTPEQYTRFYDVVTTAMRKVDPKLKFVALAEAQPSLHPDMFEYFLNPAHHAAGAPVDFISYHFYAYPTAEQTLADWQYTFFYQATDFLHTVAYIETIRKRYLPATKTDLDELGVILPEDIEEINREHYTGKAPPPLYWNLNASMFAMIYAEAAKLGIDVIGESQLVGFPSQFPSVSMMNYDTAEPNPRFWVLKLLKDNFAPGDKLVETKLDNESLYAQAFETTHGKSVLVLNKRNRVVEISLPTEAVGGTLMLVAPSTGDKEPTAQPIAARDVTLQPFEVAVVRYHGGKK